MDTKILQEKKIVKGVKNFSYIQENSMQQIEYIQYLCRFKKNITEDVFLKFLDKVKTNSKLPNNMASVLNLMAACDVIDFTGFLTLIKQDNTDISEAIQVATEFLEMFEFGNRRVKNAHHIGLDMFFAQKATFGNIEKDKRLFHECHSVQANSTILELTHFNIYRNAIRNVKDEKKGKAK